MPRRLHILLHLCALGVASAGMVQMPSAVAPWVCLVAHGMGVLTHVPESNPNRDVEFLGILRVSLGVVACLVSAGQHWVVGITGWGYVVLAGSMLMLEWVRPKPEKLG